MSLHPLRNSDVFYELLFCFSVSILDEEPADETSGNETDDLENIENSDETSSGSGSSDDDDHVPLRSRQQEAKDSPLKLRFRPISQQTDESFDYHNQFRKKVQDPKRFNRASKPKKKGKKRKTTKKKTSTAAKKSSASKKSTASKKKGTLDQPTIHFR